MYRLTILLTIYVASTSLVQAAATLVQRSPVVEFDDPDFPDWVILLPGYKIPVLGSSERAELWRSRFGREGADEWRLTFEEATALVDSDLSSKSRREIEVDLARSGPIISAVGKQDQLGRVLRAFAVRSPDFGYVQGMNFLAAQFLVLGFSEEEAFQGLAYVVEEVMDDYFTQDFKGIDRDLLRMKETMFKVDLELHAKIAKLESIDEHTPFLKSLLCDFLLTVFARALKPAVLLRIWDAIFLHGREALVATTVALLRTQANKCFKLTDDSPWGNSQCLKGEVSRIDHAENLLEDIAEILPLVPQ